MYDYSKIYFELLQTKMLIDREVTLLYNLSTDPIGHGIEHAAAVTLLSIQIAEKLNNEITIDRFDRNIADTASIIDIHKMFIIAMYHDVGLIKGRTDHEFNSGKILRMNKNLLKLYNEYDIDEMVEAVEDHRASLNGEPRSIYGKILSQADRGYSIHELINRSIAHTAALKPNATSDDTVNIVFSHISDKYGKDGYAWKHIYFNNDITEKFKKDCIDLVDKGYDYFRENYYKIGPSEIDKDMKKEIEYFIHFISVK